MKVVIASMLSLFACDSARTEDVRDDGARADVVTMAETDGSMSLSDSELVEETTGADLAPETNSPDVTPAETTPETTVDTSPSEVDTSPSEVDTSPSEVDTSPSEVDAIAEATDAAPDVTAACPGPPYGTGIGDVLADYTLYDCEGDPVPLHAACGDPVTYLNLFAGWCPPCNTHARAAPADYADFKAAVPDGSWLFVITEDSAGLAPDLDYCVAVRDGFSLPMTVLVDLDGGLPAHLGVGSPNSWYIVTSRGLRLEAKVKYDKDKALGIARDLAP